MENPADDPREFGHPDLAEYGPEALPPGIDNFLSASIIVLSCRTHNTPPSVFTRLNGSRNG